MKKLFALLLALAMLSALLCGCGEAETAEAPEDAQSQTETQDGTEAETTDPAAETAENGGQAENGENAEGTTAPAKEAVVLYKGGVTEVKDLYRLSNVSADSGKAYSYVKGTDHDASILSWEVPEGQTAVAVRVTAENLGQEAVTFPEDIGGILVTDSGKIYIATTMQENPGQTAEDGNSYPSKKAVPLEKGQSAVIWMLCNVPTEVLNSGEGLHANFIMGDNTSYDVDLRAVM